MKNTIEWHKQCLVNMRSTLERYEALLAEDKARVDRLRSEVARYVAQIEAAEAAGKDGFDAERYKAVRG